MVGEYDQGSRDEEEQAFLIRNVSVHERFHHAAPMSYDIALVELQGHIQLGRLLSLWVTQCMLLYIGIQSSICRFINQIICLTYTTVQRFGVT